MPGGDISDLTLRRLADMASTVRRDRLAVACLVASLFPTTQEAHAALQATMGASVPTGGRTRREKATARVAADMSLWAVEIAPLLAQLAAREAADLPNPELESE